MSAQLHYEMARIRQQEIAANTMHARHAVQLSGNAQRRPRSEGLAGFGILRGRPDLLVESGAVWLFFPHGIGHLVGLGVRDAGGTPLPERRNDPKPYPNLRINLPLQPGMVVTVEPGVYLAPAFGVRASRLGGRGGEVPLLGRRGAAAARGRHDPLGLGIPHSELRATRASRSG